MTAPPRRALRSLAGGGRPRRLDHVGALPLEVQRRGVSTQGAGHGLACAQPSGSPGRDAAMPGNHGLTVSSTDRRALHRSGEDRSASLVADVLDDLRVIPELPPTIGDPDQPVFLPCLEGS